MARIVAVANQKGGVGKTTTVLNLGVCLARRARVLLLDLDPQASLTLQLGFDPYRLERSSYSLLVFDGMSVARGLRTLSSGLALVPASVDLATASIRMAQGHHPLGRLRQALRDSRLPFDYILLDTPPGLTVLAISALIAADEVVVPVQCTFAAINGVRVMQDVVRRIRQALGNPDLRLRGVLPTFFEPQSAFGQKALDELHALLPDLVFAASIPYDPLVADSPFHGRSVVDDNPSTPGSLAYQAFADEFIRSAPVPLIST